MLQLRGTLITDLTLNHLTTCRYTTLSLTPHPTAPNRSCTALLPNASTHLVLFSDRALKVCPSLVLSTNHVCRYAFNVYQCQFDATVDFAPYERVKNNPETECTDSGKHWALVEKTAFTIANANDKTSITYGCDAHRGPAVSSQFLHRDCIHHASISPQTVFSARWGTVKSPVHQLMSVVPRGRRYATLESIITEEITFVDGGIGYKMGRSGDGLVISVRNDSKAPAS